MIEHQKIGKKEAIAEAVKLMKRFHIGDEEEVAAVSLHLQRRHESQRAMIAMGIIAGADMILADEPTKGLDRERIEMVVDAFHSLKDQAVLCVTHDLNFAREMSDSVFSPSCTLPTRWSTPLRRNFWSIRYTLTHRI